MLSEKIRIDENPVMDLLNHIENEVSIFDVKKIIFRMENDWIVQVHDASNISATNFDKNFICIKNEEQFYFINMNKLIEVVIEYDNNNSGI